MRKKYFSFTQAGVIQMLQKGGKIYVFVSGAYLEVYLDDCDGNTIKFIMSTFNVLKYQRLIEAKQRMNENTVIYGLTDKGKEIEINM